MMKRLIRTLGPGLLFASTSIGVSHLVQSTRAGADFGLALIWAVVLSNLFKFPFFEYGSRYAAATGMSIIDGYKTMGTWCLRVYAFITFGSMFIITAAVTYVTSGFFSQLYGFDVQWVIWVALGLLLAVALFVSLGRFSALTDFIKILAIVLFFSTIAAFVLACFNVQPMQDFGRFSGSSADWLFVVALMGWMPTALDLSAWNSLWTVEKIKENQENNWTNIRREFSWSYFFAAFLSVLFLLLGMFLLYAKSQTLPEGAPAFAAGVVRIYTESIGEWSYWLISASAFSIMLGTMIGVFDGYSRTLIRILELEFEPHMIRPKRLRLGAIWVLAIGTFLLIFFAQHVRFKELIDFATHVSFLIAPIIAYWNFRLVMRLPNDYRPGIWMRSLSIGGIGLLLVFSLVYLVIQFV